VNWLCHALLVRPDPLAQAGAVLADDLKGAARIGLPDAVHHGIRHHEAVDRFTDAHPAILRSKARVPAPHRRYAGVLVDVFYGRLLAEAWPAARHGPPDARLARLHHGLASIAPTLEPWPQGLSDG
jgi:acyl carrier protein phosphodiesterase